MIIVDGEICGVRVLMGVRRIFAGGGVTLDSIRLTSLYYLKVLCDGHVFLDAYDAL